MFASNKKRLSGLVVNAVAKTLVEDPAVPRGAGGTSGPRVQYRAITIAGDGRCGWRSLIASKDVALYESVPRTGLQPVPVLTQVSALTHNHTHILSVK